MALMSVCFVACGNNTTTDNETTTATKYRSHLLKILRRVEIQEKLTNKNDGVIGDIGDDIEEGVDDIVGDGNDENTTDTTNNQNQTKNNNKTTTTKK